MQEAPLSHDILVFMTGQEEIEALARTCRDIAKHLPDGCGPMVVIPLYASLPPAQQLRVFLPAPKVNVTVSQKVVSKMMQPKQTSIYALLFLAVSSLFKHVILFLQYV